MNTQSPKDPIPPVETAKKIARTFFGVNQDNASRHYAIRQLLIAAILSAVLVPILFYLRFGEVGPIGWGMAIFLTVYCLLTTIGLYFLPRTEYHSTVPLRGDWLDRLGAFWLVCCAFGPFFGWVITAAFPLTVVSWRWLYCMRVLIAAGLPLITALPLFRYLRGKAIWIALPLLLFITFLPILSVSNVSRDLWQGPIVRQVQTMEDPAVTVSELYLSNTHQVIGVMHQ